MTFSGPCIVGIFVLIYFQRDATLSQFIYFWKTVLHVSGGFFTHTVICAPDDGWRYHPKHVEQFSRNKCTVKSCVSLEIYQNEYTYGARTAEHHILDMFRTVIVHHQEVCTSSLQYFTVHLNEESSRWHNIFRIVSATGQLLQCMVKYYRLLVQNSSWWWKNTCSKHVEDNLSEMNY